MANKIEFNILVNGVEEVKGKLNKVAEGFEDFSKLTKKLSKDLKELGGTIALVGASITGPLVLAFNNAAKSSSAVRDQTEKFKNTILDFQKVIAQSLLPIFQRFNNILDDLFKRFNSLDKNLRDQIIQGALLAGIFLTLGGSLIFVTGKTLGFISALTSLISRILLLSVAELPFIAISLAIIAIIVLMIKFKDVADVVISTFQIMFIFLENGFLTVRAAVEKFGSISLEVVANVLDALSKVPGPQQQSLKDFSDNIRHASVLAEGLANEDIQAVIEKSKELDEIFKTGQGSFSLTFDEMKTKFEEFIALINGGGIGSSGGGNSPYQGFIDGFKAGLDEIKFKLTDLRQQGINFAQTLQTGLSNAFSDIILGSKSAGEAFAEFGKIILKSLVDFIAQWVAFQILSKVFTTAATALGVATAATLAAAYAPAAAFASLASFGANAAPAAAGLTSTVTLANLLAIPKFAQGSMGIKDDTVGLFNKGEIVIPNSFSSGIRSGELSLSGGGQGGSPIIFDFSGAQFNGITPEFVKKIFQIGSEGIANRTISFRGA